MRAAVLSQTLVTRVDRDYPEAVAHLERQTGFIDVQVTDLEGLNRFEAGLGTDRRWLVVSGVKPT